MNQYQKPEPEFIVEESVKIPPMVNKQDNFVRDLQVDIRVLLGELTKLVDFSGRIEDDIRVLVLLQRGMA